MPTARGNIGKCFPATAPSIFIGQFTRVKQPTPVVVALTGATPNNRMNLSNSGGTYVGRCNVNAAGIGYFYDLDDGGYVAYEIGTGNAWSISVSGSTVTILKIASSGSSFAVYAA